VPDKNERVIFLDTNKRTLKLYWEQMRKYKKSFFIALVCIPIAALLTNTLLPYFFSLTIGGLASSNQSIIWGNLQLAAGIGLVGVIINYIGFQALIFHEASVRSSLSDATFESLIRKDMRFFINEKVGALTSRFIDFTRSQVNLQDLFIVQTLGFILSVGTGLVIVATKSWPLAIVIIVLITSLILQVRWSINKRKPWRHRRKELTGEIHGGVADAFTNNLIVKTFASEDVEVETISNKNKLFREIFIKDIGFVMKEGSARVAIMVIMQIIAISLCAYFVLRKQMDLAIAIFALTYLQRIASQIFELGGMLNGYDQALLEAAPMSDMLAKESVINDKPNAIKLHNITPTINLNDLSYRYDDTDIDVLKNINLTITAGEKIGLVGNSGAGKTTITHLLLRFSDVSSGAILIDGHDIRDVTQESLRQNIAYVPQDPMLFHRSLKENIIYGKQNATDKEVRRAIEQANASEFIDRIPHGLDAIVGERGIKLSGGQRQRIAIARAILKNAPILILDEATSALDSENEKLIQSALTKLMIGRTSIVIAHRLSTIAKLDRIVVLDDGKIVEQGSHSELLKNGGIYAKLWSHQSGGFIEE
jgi:ATP-binding cassette subfamily B protein